MGAGARESWDQKETVTSVDSKPPSQPQSVIGVHTEWHHLWISAGSEKT